MNIENDITMSDIMSYMEYHIVPLVHSIPVQIPHDGHLT